MSFGLKNTSTSFQRSINKIFTKKLDIFVILYLDDIFIYTDNDRNRHVTVIKWILKQPRKFLLYANLQKCQIYQKEILFLGYMLLLKNICIENKKIKAVNHWPESQSI